MSTDYTSPTERVQVRLEGSTLHIVFNNPARHNALSLDMWGAVPALLAQAETDERVRVVVFSGANITATIEGQSATYTYANTTSTVVAMVGGSLEATGTTFPSIDNFTVQSL